MMKRILALLLTIVMFASVGAFAAVTAGEFPDVADSHANADAIKHYAQAGVINGYPDGSFGPDKPITRGEFVKMLMVYAGNEKANTEGVKTGFPDVDGAEGKEAHWAHPHIRTAVDLKIVNGYPDGTFRPDDNVKYEEAIKMMVCYLGGETAAKDKVKGTNLDVYPEGYIRVASEKMMNINLASSLGKNASRADVAQILYNSKDIKKLGGSAVVIPSGTGGGGGGVIIGGGDTTPKKYTLDESISMGKNWTGSRDGVVVAAGRINAKDRQEDYFLESRTENGEEGLTARDGSNEEFRSTISAYQLIVKMDLPVARSAYILLTDESKNEYYDYLGHHVSVNFTYNGSRNKFYIRSLESLQEKETLGSITGSTILKSRTDAYNATATEDYGIVYYDAAKDKEITVKLPRDLNNLKVIYNEKVVDTSQTPLTIEDFMPKNGTVSFVKKDRNTYRLIRITEVDTYVVGRAITSVPRGITDKYRKAADGVTPLQLTLDDKNPDIDLIVKNSSGTSVEVSALKKGNILEVASSKCGKYINVTVNTTEMKNKVIYGMSAKEGVAFESTLNRYYPFADYYNTYVKNGLDIDVSDRVTAGVNAAGEIVWLEETEPVYKIGYLKKAELNASTNEITVWIVQSGSTAVQGTYVINNFTKVGTPSVTGETYNAGEKRKYTDMQELLNVLEQQAAIINSGKSSQITGSARVAQPVRFVANGGKIEILETMALDTANKFTGTALTYSEDEGKKFSGTVGGNPVEFSATSSDTIYIFVPNDRSWDATIYKMGTVSQINSPTPKLVNYGKYNIEPYFIPNVNGGFARKVFVVYNENIDAQPNYRSETIIVESKMLTANSNQSVYKITPKNGYGNSKASYNTTSLNAINAYVLDANFERMTDENGTPIKREIMEGDVIRFGYAPGGAIMNLEILYDASEPMESRKKITYDNSGSLVDYDSFPYKSLISYYGRVGLITYVPDNPEFCELSVGAGQTSNMFVENYSSQRVLLNTYAGDNSTFEVKTMDDLNPGDMVYVWQYYSGGLKFKYIYAVRYEDDLMGSYEDENTPAPDPDEGENSGNGNSGTPGSGESGEPTQPDSGSTETPDLGENGEPTQPDNGSTETPDGETEGEQSQPDSGE